LVGPLNDDQLTKYMNVWRKKLIKDDRAMCRVSGETFEERARFSWPCHAKSSVALMREAAELNGESFAVRFRDGEVWLAFTERPSAFAMKRRVNAREGVS
jgi:hypothetical protein